MIGPGRGPGSSRPSISRTGTSPASVPVQKASSAPYTSVRLKSLSSSSDHAAFHATGVPILKGGTGFHDDYHKASDEARKIDHRGIVAIAKLGFLVTLAASEDPADLRGDVDPDAPSARESARALDMKAPAPIAAGGLRGSLDR